MLTASAAETLSVARPRRILVAKDTCPNVTPGFKEEKERQYIDLEIDPARIELSSATEHHGIEVIYPGPALLARDCQQAP